MSEPEFSRLYRRFLGLVAQPRPLGEVALSPLSSWIEAPSEEHAASRLGIYAHMYFTRLRDSLREDFARFAALVDPEVFDRLAVTYLVEHPSDNPSLRYHGRHFPDFIARRANEFELPAELADLCRLEWARIEVFDAEHAKPLTTEEVGRLASHEWQTLILGLVPAHRFVDTRHSVESLWQAEAPALEVEQTLLVWRRGFTVFHRALDADEAHLLRALSRPLPFVELCAAACERTLEPDPERLFRWLRQWLADELLIQSTQ